MEILATIKKLSEEIAVIGVFHDLNLNRLSATESLSSKTGRSQRPAHPVEVITPAMLRSIFDLDAAVSIHPVTGKPLVVHSPGPPKTRAGNLRVHVICGGGTGLEIIRALHRAGCGVTSGHSSMNDTDYGLLVELGYCLHHRTAILVR